VEWSAKTLPGITNARKFEFDTSNDATLVHCYELSTSEKPFQIVPLQVEESEAEKARKKEEKGIEMERKRVEKKLEKEKRRKEKLEIQSQSQKKASDENSSDVSEDDCDMKLDVTVTTSRLPRTRKSTQRLITET